MSGNKQPKIRPSSRPKNLGDLFYTDHKDWRRYRNKIDRKHVDFLIYNQTTFEPVLEIELDDSSHNNLKANQRQIQRQRL